MINPAYTIRFLGLPPKLHKQTKKLMMNHLCSTLPSPYVIERISSTSAKLFCPRGHLDEKYVLERLATFGDYVQDRYPDFQLELERFEESVEIHKC